MLDGAVLKSLLLVHPARNAFTSVSWVGPRID